MFAKTELSRNNAAKIKVALAAAIIVSTAVSASAATKHPVVPRHRTAIYNVAPGYTNPSTRSDPNAPSQTGGGSLGYNQMLLID
jgi:hypothetical protein